MSDTETEHQTTDAERHKRSREVYERVLRGVDLQSGHMQPPLAKQSSVIQSVHASGYGDYGLEETHRAIVAALSNGDLFRAEDSEGVTRLGINDAERLREKIGATLSRKDDPRKDIIGLANQRIQQLRGERDG